MAEDEDDFVPPQVNEEVCKQEHWNNLKFSMQFVLNIISNTKFSEKLGDKDLEQALRSRFESGVPLKYIDFVFV